MRKPARTILCFAAALSLAWASGSPVSAQTQKPRQTHIEESKFMEYGVVDGDTVFYDVLKPARVFERIPHQKGRNWRKYYKLVYNFSRVYPYALTARTLLERTDSSFSAGHFNRRQKEKYINQLQKELFEYYEEPLRHMSLSQGKLLIKLIGRETGLTPYEIIKDYKSGIAATFWQGIAKMFSGDLKKKYDPKGEDKAVEDLVEYWNSGDFESFYWSLFGEYPKIPVIPEKHR
jgi:hypothetical protein